MEQDISWNVLDKPESTSTKYVRSCHLEPGTPATGKQGDFTLKSVLAGMSGFILDEQKGVRSVAGRMHLCRPDSACSQVLNALLPESKTWE